MQNLEEHERERKRGFFLRAGISFGKPRKGHIAVEPRAKGVTLAGCQAEEAGFSVLSFTPPPPYQYPIHLKKEG